MEPLPNGRVLNGLLNGGDSNYFLNGMIHSFAVSWLINGDDPNHLTGNPPSLGKGGFRLGGPGFLSLVVWGWMVSSRRKYSMV